MTAKKPVEVTAPVIPADEAFANMIMSQRDASVVAGQKLQGDLIARNEQFERESSRLHAAWKADADALADQIAQHARICQAADAALDAVKAPSNVVPLQQAGE